MYYLKQPERRESEMRNAKTKTPITTNVYPTTFSVTDSFANEDFDAEGTVTVHKYVDGTQIVFAQAKTPFGLGTLKLSFNPILGWHREAIQSPASWLHVNWFNVNDTLMGVRVA